ncbi:hypothetical protein FRC01_000084 [Tulasnella sp. 417]|nr:hypothetical protein FRC01_000084 [Tulasnella sp. 417]
MPGLFPNLHTLVWKAPQRQGYREKTLDAVSYFLSPSLKHLYVSGILGPLAEQHPSELIWIFFQKPKVDCAPFFRTMNAMDGLRLESLELRIRQSVGLRKDHEVGLFLRQHQDSLQHFHTWTPEIVHLFQNEILGLSRLRSIEAVANGELEAIGFIDGLADRIPGLEVLHLTVREFEEAERWRELWSAMKRLRNITKLHLRVHQIEGLDEEDAKSMKKAWPALSSLYIVQEYGGWMGTPQGLSLDFLSAVTLHFSKSLTELGLFLDPNVPSAHPISPVRLEKLQHLYIQSSSGPEDPEGLVRYLARILPHEAEFKGDFSDEWDPVVDGLRQTRANQS